MRVITTLSAHELSEMYKNKEVTVPEVVKAYLEKIKAIDSDIKAYITICEESALKRAEEIQAKFDAGEKLGPLADGRVYILFQP